MTEEEENIIFNFGFEVDLTENVSFDAELSSSLLEYLKYLFGAKISGPGTFHILVRASKVAGE